jgi:hypothetical protein
VQIIPQTAAHKRSFLLFRRLSCDPQEFLGGVREHGVLSVDDVQLSFELHFLYGKSSKLAAFDLGFG